MMTGKPAYYPPVAFTFSVKLEGAGDRSEGGFSEVSGLSTEVNLAEVHEGGENRFVHRLPHQAMPENLVLKRGILLSRSPLFAWCKETLEADFTGSVTPRTLVITLMDPKDQPMIAWELAQAWPVKWTISELRAEETAIAIETLEFAYRSLTRKVQASTLP